MVYYFLWIKKPVYSIHRNCGALDCNPTDHFEVLQGFKNSSLLINTIHPLGNLCSNIKPDNIYPELVKKKVCADRETQVFS